MAKEILSADTARSLLVERWRAAMEKVTPEAIASGKHGERHEFEIRVLRCGKQNIILMCSRRAGKSEVCVGLVLLTIKIAMTMLDPAIPCLYLGLTKDAAEPVWRKWKKLLKKFNLYSLTESSDSEQFTYCPATGARVLFTGTDDLRRVSHLLGDQLAGGIAIIDESQSDPGLMETTVEDTLGPMLDETTHEKPIPGRLILSGTVPDAPVGYFWRTWIENRNNEDTETAEGSKWETFAWSRYDNPFQTNNEQRENDYCEKYKKKHDDPAVLRRFHGLRTWGKLSNVYRFDKAKHVYYPDVMTTNVGSFNVSLAARSAQFDRTIVGIQQNHASGRFGIVAWTWDHVSKNQLLQIAEAIAPEEYDPLESEWIAVLAKLRSFYSMGTMEFIRDSEGSSDPVNKALRMSHGIEVKSTIKTVGGQKARVQRLADLFHLGIAKAISGSMLSDDLSVARWNEKSKAAKRWDLDDTQYSPSLAKAATNALDLPSYTAIGGMKPQAKPMTTEERLEEEQRKHLESMVNGKKTYRPNRQQYDELWLPPNK